MIKNKTGLGIAGMVVLLLLSVVILILYAGGNLSIKGNKPVEADTSGSYEDDIPDKDGSLTDFSFSDMSYSDMSASDDAPVDNEPADEPSEAASAATTATTTAAADEKTDTSDASDEYKKHTGRISVKSGAFRTEPSVNAALIKYLRKNTKVTIIGQKGSWFNVEYNGRTGWIAEKCIDEE